MNRPNTMTALVDLLVANPLLLLFLIAAISYPLGRIKIKGTSLGVAAVLFVGLAVNAINPNLRLPEVIYQLGAVLFVYTLGLSGGPGFFASFRGKGLRESLFVTAILIGAAVLTVIAHYLLHLTPTLTAGMYAGSLTNTPALAGVIDYVKANASGASLDTMMAEPVIGYSITYPMGVIAMIACILALKRYWRVDYAAEASRLRALGGTSQHLTNRTVRVTVEMPVTATLQELTRAHGWDVNFGRLKRDGKVVLATGDTLLVPGDLVSLVGSPEELADVTAYLGQVSDEQLDLDRSEFDYRRMFVSNPKLVGQTLGDINLPQQFGAIATRVRRGDIEMLARDDMVLELGDRVRITARRENMDAISRFFGDSYRALSEIDVLSFSLGIGLGLLVGLIPIPLPGGLVFKLGFAGGPLLVALILGSLQRTGPLVWTLPYSANLTLRQIGLIMFLAGIGTRAGYAFISTFGQGGGLRLFIAGTVITTLTALATLWIGYRLLKISMSLLIGLLAGLQTQPAVLGFALEQTGNDLPNLGYARMFALAVIVKIILAQLLVAFLP
jgi:putative transport protein